MVYNYRTLYAEAREYDNVDMYIMERGWQDWMDAIGNAEQIADLLRAVYAISCDGIHGMLATDGTKLTEFCKRYALPYTTAMKWKRTEAVPAEHTMLLLGYAIVSNKTA